MNRKKLLFPSCLLLFVAILGVWLFRPVTDPDAAPERGREASSIAVVEAPQEEEPRVTADTRTAEPNPDPVTPRQALLEGGVTVSVSRAMPLGDNLYRRQRVVRLADGVFKHPYIRTTETFRLEAEEFRQDPELRRVGEDRLVEALEEVADHVVVRVPEGMNAEMLRDALEGTGLEIYQELDTPHTYILQIPFQTVHAIEYGLEVAARLPEAIRVAQPNTIFHAAFTEPDDLHPELWGLWNTDNDNHIFAPQAWDLTTGSRNIVVAVIDTGVDYRHPDLAANMWVNPDPNAPDRHGYDFHNRNPDPLDDHGHGTHCAGTIGAVGNNNIGIVGVNWEVSIMAIKFLSRTGSGSLADGLDSVNYATANGAHITNNSWGAAMSPLLEGDVLREAFADQLAAGVGVVAAAGNSQSDNAVSPQIPAAYPLHEEGLLSVAASTVGGFRAWFSNYGLTTVDLAAPGAAIYSTLTQNTYASWSGTSMAAPHVAGVYALMLDLYPELPPAQAREILMESVDPSEHWEGLVRSGGRLNAYSTLQRIGGGPLIYIDTLSMTETSGDGVVSPGETVTYSLAAENRSFIYDSTDVQVAATVTQGADWLTLTGGALTYGDMPTQLLRRGVQTPIRDIFIAGLDPADENDVLEILGMNLETGELQFQAREGREYEISGVTELPAGEADWQVLRAFGADTPVDLNGAGRLFLRLRVRLAVP